MQKKQVLHLKEKGWLLVLKVLVTWQLVARLNTLNLSWKQVVKYIVCDEKYMHVRTPWYPLEYYRTPWYTFVHGGTLWYTAVPRGALWYPVIHCSTLWYTVVPHGTM